MATKSRASLEEIDLENANNDTLSSSDTSRIVSENGKSRKSSKQSDDDRAGGRCSKASMSKNKKFLIIVGSLTVIVLVGLILIVIFSVTGKKKESPTETIEPPVIQATSRLDCLPWLKSSVLSSSSTSSLNIETECSKLAYCKYQLVKNDTNLPACFIDKAKFQQEIVEKSQTPLGDSYKLKLNSKSNDEESTVYLMVEYLEDNVLHFKIHKSGDYEVPIKLKSSVKKSTNPKYEVNIEQSRNENGSLIGLTVLRKSTGRVLWDTSLGPLIYEKHNRQIATVLPSEFIYGFGENKHKSFKHNMNYQNWPVWARDEPPENVDYANLYGSQPFYLCMEPDGKSHGVLLYNSNAFEYELIPNPGLIYRTTGGAFDFYIFLGPDPESVIQQLTSYIGHTFMPPYWALGFQISRYGYKDTDDMKRVLERFKEHEIPLDTQVADIDHYDKRKDFTIDPINWKDLPEYFAELHKQGMRTVMILDPALIVNETDYWPYSTGRENNVFITWPSADKNPDFQDTNSSIMLGYCWPTGKVAYPDFFKSSTKKWWIDSIKRHYQTLKFDGLWIDMNEPAVFGTNEERPFNWPEDVKPYWSLKCPDDDDDELVKTKASYLYRSDNKLSDKTLCMQGRQGENDEYKHFDVHNLYGLTESVPTFEVARDVTDTRGFLITRSTFIGSGQYGGHWTGDNHSRWSHLYYSIIGMLEFNMFGISYVGADICGFWQNVTSELCARWSELGAFYPFSRNHNNEKNNDQDPGAMGEPVITAAKKALDIRYEILPYYYTLFYKSHKHGSTVVRPLFHEFPADQNTYSIDKQFLVGPAFLVTPVLDEFEEQVSGYFPYDHWYDYYTGRLDQSSDPEMAMSVGKYLTLEAPIDHIPLHVRGGHILPTQQTANTTHYARMNPFGLIIAPNEDGEAIGDLFYDDGISKDLDEKYIYFTFIVRDNQLEMNIEHNSMMLSEEQQQTLRLDKIRLFTAYWHTKGFDMKKLKFYLNEELIDQDKIEVDFDEIKLSSLDISMSKPFKLEWSFDEEKYPIAGGGVETPVAPIIDCSIQNVSITEEDCRKKKCEFNAEHLTTPKCYIPKSLGGYLLVNRSEEEHNEVFYLQKDDAFELIKDEIKLVMLDVSHGKIVSGERVNRLTRLRIVDPNDASRYKVPVALNFEESDEKFLQLSMDEKRFSFEIKSSTGESILNNRNAENAFVYADQLIQIVLNFDYENLYGFGENTHSSFRHVYDHSNWWGIFARDQPTGYDGLNAYGTHPFLMAINKENGRAFGMLIFNSNAQEYGFIPYNSFSYRTLGGILDIYMLEEETPEKLIQAYTSLIGKPYLPPYWSLGFQLSRYGYNSLENLRAAVSRTVNARIPLDIQYADIDHFRKQLDFTYDEVAFKGLPEYIDELKTNGVKFIIILDPAINSEEPDYEPFINGTAMDAWIKWPSDQNPQIDELNGNNPYMLGYVWPEGKTVFPDFFKTRTKEWWKNFIVKHHDTLRFDGLWIDMNEPANFDTNKDKPFNWPPNRPDWNLICPKNKYDDPAFLPLIAQPFGNVERMSDKTLCMIAMQGEQDEFIHYDVHNLYGWSQTEPTLKALRETLNRRSIVISRSTFVSSGAYAGHWLGDNKSVWSHLKFNIIGMIEANLFGIPYIGADICGFFYNTTAEMCTRWMQLGAFNTFFRNHNGFEGIDQDPAALGADVATASREIVEIRYSLLPYLYSLFYYANQHGGTVIRSLAHEFSKDPRTYNIDRQFMWGSSLLISPVLERNKRSVFAYFPNDRWFNFYDGRELKETGRIHELHAPLDHIPIHIRGGSILITQEPAINTQESRKNSFGLVVAMPTQLSTQQQQDTVVNAVDFFWDDGDEIDYLASSSLINIQYTIEKGSTEHVIQFKLIRNKYTFTSKLHTLKWLGVARKPQYVELNDGSSDQPAALINDYVYDEETKVLTVSSLDIDLNLPNLIAKITMRI